MADGLLLDLSENISPVTNNEGSVAPAPALIEDIVTPDESTSPSQPEASVDTILDTIAPKPLEFINRELEDAANPTEPIKPVETPSATQPEPEKPIANGTHPLETSSSTPDNALPTEQDSTVSSQEQTEEEEKKTVEPQDPRLKEIEAKFGGKWKMVRSDPYDEYLKTLGVGYFSRKIAGRAYHEMEVLITEDSTITVAMKSLLHSQSYVWKLDEEVENVVEKAKQSVVCTYENGKLVQQMTSLEPGSNKMQQVERAINDIGEHEVIFTAGEAICRRYYARIPDPNAAPVTEQKPPKEAPAEGKDEENKETEKPIESQDKPAEQKEETTEQQKAKTEGTLMEQPTELLNEEANNALTEETAGQTEPTEQSSQPAEEAPEQRPRTPSESSA